LTILATKRNHRVHATGPSGRDVRGSEAFVHSHESDQAVKQQAAPMALNREL
jgi:hypothetical protein